uniref:Uncharacterized protein n=1 Tax=Rhizophora mucronata TaxID=61149 RepID=A0A2P2QYH4_RHIMU
MSSCNETKLLRKMSSCNETNCIYIAREKKQKGLWWIGVRGL